MNKDITLQKIIPNERILKYVALIDFLDYNEECNCIQFNNNDKNGILLYDINCNYIMNTDYNNLLLNNYIIEKAINNDINNISQAQFADLLENHLYLSYLNTINQLLPIIKLFYPESFINNHDVLKLNYKYDLLSYSDGIIIAEDCWLWEDKSNLKIKSFKNIPDIDLLKNGYKLITANFTLHIINNKLYRYFSDEDSFYPIDFEEIKEYITKIFDADGNLIWKQEEEGVL